MMMFPCLSQAQREWKNVQRMLPTPSGMNMSGLCTVWPYRYHKGYLLSGVQEIVLYMDFLSSKTHLASASLAQGFMENILIACSPLVISYTEHKYIISVIIGYVEHKCITNSHNLLSWSDCI